MSDIGICACDTTEVHPASECTVPGQPLYEVLFRDVRDLCAALGLGVHARTYSAHAVIHREMLPAIRRLREMAVEMINAPDDSAADWGYALAHQLGMLDADGDR